MELMHLKGTYFNWIVCLAKVDKHTKKKQLNPALQGLVFAS
jgi:hypothetical protein